VFGVDVHELQLEVRDSIFLGALEHEGDGVALIRRLEGDYVVTAGAFEHLRHGFKTDAEAHVAVATELLETVLAEL